MATLEQQRRAIGAANEAARRGMGKGNEAARRGLGASLEAQRRGTSVIDDLNSVIVPAQQGRLLPALEPRGARPAVRGSADYTAPPAGRGGIASPLKEVANTATYWPQGFLSSDGLFVLPAARKRQFTDANGDTVVIEFVDPEGTV